MKSKEWLFEAEQSVAKKKIDQQLDQLSDQEIDALLSMITTSLEEGRFTYDPLAGPAPGQSQTTKPQQQKPQQPQQQKKPEPQKQQPKPKSEVKAYVDDLDNKEKEALKAILQKEKTVRKTTGEKVNTPPKPASKLKNILGAVLIAAVAAGIVGNIGGDKTPSKTIDKPAATAQAEKPDAVKSRWKVSSGTSGIENTPWKEYTTLSSNKPDGMPMGLVISEDGYLTIKIYKGALDPQNSASSPGVYWGDLKIKFDDGGVEEYGYLTSVKNLRTGELLGGNIGDRAATEKLINKFKNSTKVKIEVPMYEGGPRVFEFETAGLKDLMQKGKK
jgi:hypothetical protein